MTYQVKNTFFDGEQHDIKTKFEVMKFNGDAKKTDEASTFVAHCELIFGMQPQQFRSDTAKIAFMLVNFRDAATRWINPYLKLSDDLEPGFLHDYGSFTKELIIQFGDPHERSNAADKVGRMKMKTTQTAREFFREFHEQAVKLPDWSDSALSETFYKALTQEIKQVIAIKHTPHPSTLSAMRDAAFDVDYSLSRIQREKEDSDKYVPRKEQGRWSGDVLGFQGRDKEGYQGGRSGQFDRSNYNPERQQGNGNDKRVFDSKAPYHKPTRTPEEEAEYRKRMAEGACAGCGSKDHNYNKCHRNPTNRPTDSWRAPPLAPAEETKARQVSILQRSTINELDEEEDDDASPKN
jgi:hypothetical protein